jgi:hypothetical protein
MFRHIDVYRLLLKHPKLGNVQTLSYKSLPLHEAWLYESYTLQGLYEIIDILPICPFFYGRIA